MKIENNHSQRILQKQTENTNPVERSNRSHEMERADFINGKDQASLSEKARLLSKARAELEETPEIRTDLVAHLRTQVETGEYKISYDRLATRLIKQLYAE